MEIALCIDNAIFITILAGRLPTKSQRNRARAFGIFVAMIINLLMISIIKLHDSMSQELFTLFEHSYNFQDLILIAGGVFLIANSTIEIHNKMEGDEDNLKNNKISTTVPVVLVKMTLMNIVFSFDSVLTSIAMVHEVWKMILAIVIALLVMYLFLKPIDSFVKKHPTSKILALSFLMLIGLVLIMEGLEEGVDKAYVYFAMAFSIFVEAMNIMILKRNKKSEVVHLHEPHLE
jgi:predicted tellurium resistance membrane protein TerC